MGKENIGPRRKFLNEDHPKYDIDKQFLSWVTTEQWSNPNDYKSIKEIIPNSNIDIIITNGIKQYHTTCNGLRPNGNTYGKLMEILMKRKLVSKNAKGVTFSLKFTPSVTTQISIFLSHVKSR